MRKNWKNIVSGSRLWVLLFVKLNWATQKDIFLWSDPDVDFFNLWWNWEIFLYKLILKFRQTRWWRSCCKRSLDQVISECWRSFVKNLSDRGLKMQATDDRSAPMIEGKCVPWKIRNYFSLPLLGEMYSRKAVPPKPTNLQCVRALEDWNGPIETDSCQIQKRSCEDGFELDPGRTQRPGRNRESRTNHPRSRSCAPPGSKKTQPTRHRWILTNVEERSWKKGEKTGLRPPEGVSNGVVEREWPWGIASGW